MFQYFEVPLFQLPQESEVINFKLHQNSSIKSQAKFNIHIKLIMAESIEPMYKKNPFAIPEPYYLPGYTGHCPAYSEIVGQTYGRATHHVMGSLQSPPGRLKSISSKPQKLPGETDLYIMENRKSEGKFVLTKDITPGYKGPIPRARDLIS
ncbi:hypothetical protein AVEN_31373-1 [Araneus ventricosus]|uniref:Ciliary microtubule inner protein 2A-C-like domain-containing protein n=1 Tax=Araneus ventricosus TaxID=182803 RepID=A0A4Y2G1T4_ARAVE|nr:hypothetical protein AVEN_31373-1 [Araneus ventricosus]